MNIGDKIFVETTAMTLKEITNVVPVKYRDDGEESWYEVCDATKTTSMAIIGKNNAVEEVIVVIDKETCDTSQLLDLL